jgi:hypothetical protein
MNLKNALSRQHILRCSHSESAMGLGRVGSSAADGRRWRRVRSYSDRYSFVLVCDLREGPTDIRPERIPLHLGRQEHRPKLPAKTG